MPSAPLAAETWKALLLRGELSSISAHAVGEMLGQLHARSRVEPGLAQEFADRQDFVALRVDPYLHVTAERRPEVSAQIEKHTARMMSVRECLVHGDYSPRTCWSRPDHPSAMILLDHEVCHWGDPTFDLAFCLTHLHLKACTFPERTSDFLDLAQIFWTAYGAAAQPVYPARAGARHGRNAGMPARRPSGRQIAGGVPHHRGAAAARPTAGGCHFAGGDAHPPRRARSDAGGRYCMSVATIERVVAREILDSRGRPTVEADVLLSDGTLGRASVPSGASTGTTKRPSCAMAKRSTTPATACAERSPTWSRASDLPYAGSRPPTRRASMRCWWNWMAHPTRADWAPMRYCPCRWQRAEQRRWARASRCIGTSPGWPTWRNPAIPLPMVNIVSGGLHAGGQIEIQDVLAMPVGARVSRRRLEWAWRVHHTVGQRVRREGYPPLVADEGGWAPPFGSNAQALEWVTDAIGAAGLRAGVDVCLAIDVGIDPLLRCRYSPVRFAARAAPPRRSVDGGYAGDVAWGIPIGVD